MATHEMTLPAYEVYAIKYAERASSSHSTFVFKDPHDAPMDMDYFVGRSAAATEPTSSTSVLTVATSAARATSCARRRRVSTYWALTQPQSKK